MNLTRPLVLTAGLFLIAAAASLAGCGGGGSSSTSSDSAAAPSNSGASSVTISDYTYKPTQITVPKGATVTFTNKDSTAHTATSKQPGAFESGSIQPGKSDKVTLEKTGIFAYYCAFHPFMKGTIVVE